MSLTRGGHALTVSVIRIFKCPDKMSGYNENWRDMTGQAVNDMYITILLEMSMQIYILLVLDESTNRPI